MWKKRKAVRKKTKKGTDSQPEQNIHIYQKEKERKNGIVDSILSRNQNMKRRSIEHHANEEGRRKEKR
jgi:hypothetical protein